ncbi:MAG TPA: Spy/CpxP family protein refolding chaperone [Polyangiaceae bacterium]|jgi:Spy/CpxP family protein refolding chaperone|nr:Spy/CpxP family protein refolding chaperone [Polyangiaceae bacterium]
MNRWIARIVTLASISGAVALVPAGVAFAQQAGDASANGRQPGEAPAKHHGHHREGLIGAALKLDSLTPAQRTSIEQLVQTRRTAEVPVRQADAQVLTALAQQVEQASIDRNALAPMVTARESAAVAARTVDLDTVQKLHDILTPAQRGQLVDGVEAHFGQNAGKGQGDGKGPGHEHGRLGMIAKKLGVTDQQKAQIMANLRAERPARADAGARPDFRAEGRAWLDSFRGDTFTASAAGANMQERVEKRADRMEDLLTAAVPVLTSAQRSELATHLRTRAQHESSHS